MMTYERIDEAVPQIENPALRDVWRSAAFALMEAESRFVSEAKGLAAHMLRTAESVERGGSVNGLGETQSQGSGVDAAAGALQACRRGYDAVNRLAFPDDDSR